MNGRRRRRGSWPAAPVRFGLLGAGLFLIPGLILPPAAWGDGGTLRVANVIMGAYRVSVYTDPTPVTPDSIDVSVLATFDRGRAVPAELEILVVARLLDGSGMEIRHPATREQAEDRRFYAAKFRPGVVGEWEIEVRLRGSEGGGEVRFRVDVRDPGPFSNPYLILGAALLPLLLVGWWLRSGSHARPEGEAMS